MFELTTAERNKPFIMMGENERQTKEWIDVIANARLSGLDKFMFHGGSSPKVGNDTKGTSALEELTQKIISKIRRLPGNDKCVDCSQPNPTWMSVNLGVLICTECSGIHRQIGVNYSKVRSLELDQIGTANLLIARTMSNETFNEVYEAVDRQDIQFKV